MYGVTAEGHSVLGNIHGFTPYFYCPVANCYDAEAKEARNVPFCPSQENFDTVVLRGVRNISEAP